MGCDEFFLDSGTMMSIVFLMRVAYTKCIFFFAFEFLAIIFLMYKVDDGILSERRLGSN